MRNLVCIIVCVYSSLVQSNDSNDYFGVAYGDVEIDSSLFARQALLGEIYYDVDGNFEIVEMTWGTGINNYLDFEVRLGYGNSGYAMTFVDLNETEVIDLNINNYSSVYLKSESEQVGFKVYGLLGYTNLKIIEGFTEIRSGNVTQTKNYDHKDSGVSYGVGLSFDIGNGKDLNIEWKKLLDWKPEAAVENLDFEISGLSIGLKISL